MCKGLSFFTNRKFSYSMLPVDAVFFFSDVLSGGGANEKNKTASDKNPKRNNPCRILKRFLNGILLSGASFFILQVLDGTLIFFYAFQYKSAFTQLITR